jgi:hypothetical protein
MASWAQHFGWWRRCFDNGTPHAGDVCRRATLVATWNFMIPDQLKYYIIISYFCKVKVLKGESAQN